MRKADVSPEPPTAAETNRSRRAFSPFPLVVAFALAVIASQLFGPVERLFADLSPAAEDPVQPIEADLARLMAEIEPAAGPDQDPLSEPLAMASELGNDGAVPMLDPDDPFAVERSDLERRRDALDLREAVVTALEKRVQDQLQALRLLRDEINGLIETLDAEDERRILRLVKTYETMKAKKAALIFNQLDGDILFAVADRMKETKMAPIIAAMEPARARQLTERLAERKNRADLLEPDPSS
ncbi:MAG: MotE family protein [Geminicoccaceae bacterium]